MSDPVPCYAPTDALTTVVRDVLDEFPQVRCWRDIDNLQVGTARQTQRRLLAAWIAWHSDPTECLTEQPGEAAALMRALALWLKGEADNRYVPEVLERNVARYAQDDIDRAIQQEVTDRQEREAQHSGRLS